MRVECKQINGNLATREVECQQLVEVGCRAEVLGFLHTEPTKMSSHINVHYRFFLEKKWKKRTFPVGSEMSSCFPSPTVGSCDWNNVTLPPVGLWNKSTFEKCACPNKNKYYSLDNILKTRLCNSQFTSTVQAIILLQIYKGYFLIWRKSYWKLVFNKVWWREADKYHKFKGGLQGGSNSAAVVRVHLEPHWKSVKQ